MRDLVTLFIHLIATLASVMRPGGARAVVAESLLLKHPMVILNRGRERAPNLRSTDRVIAGLCTFFTGTVDGPSLCRMFNHAIRGAGAPKYVSSDNDPLFRFHRWPANLRILDVTEVKSIPHLPVSHPFVERLIGTIRREIVDLVPFWHARDLEKKLSSLTEYYNDQRRHFALSGDTPIERTGKTRTKVADMHSYRWGSHCRGLYHLPVAA